MSEVLNIAEPQSSSEATAQNSAAFAWHAPILHCFETNEAASGGATGDDGSGVS